MRGEQTDVRVALPSQRTPAQTPVPSAGVVAPVWLVATTVALLRLRRRLA